MNSLKASCLLVVLCLFGTAAQAINKCTGADGKPVFQDAPCTGKGEVLTVKPASGTGVSTVAPAGTGSGARPVATPGISPSTKPAMTEAQRIEALVAASQAERRKNDLEARLVPGASDAIYQQRKSCDSEIKALQTKKLQANNNLAGATWEGSISSEMTAVATRCASHSTEARQEHENLRKECQALGGCK